MECSRLAWCVGLFFWIRSLPEPFSWLVEFIRCTIVFSACPMIRDWRTFFFGVDWIMAQVTIMKLNVTWEITELKLR